MELSYKINYNRPSIKEFLLCINRNNIYIPPDIIFYIIDFLDYTMNLDNLTLNMERIMIDTTVDNIYATLWDDLNKLHLHEYKDQSIVKWKYKDEFLYTEKEHMNNNKHFTQLDWGQSFTIFLQFCIFH